MSVFEKNKEFSFFHKLMKLFSTTKTLSDTVFYSKWTGGYSLSTLDNVSKTNHCYTFQGKMLCIYILTYVQYMINLVTSIFIEEWNARKSKGRSYMGYLILLNHTLQYMQLLSLLYLISTEGRAQPIDLRQVSISNLSVVAH